MRLPPEVDAYKKIDRKTVEIEGKIFYDPIIAGFPMFADQCPFREYCEWLISELKNKCDVYVVSCPNKIEYEDFIEIKIQILLTLVTFHLDWGIGIACATVPATPVGEEILSMIETVNRSTTENNSSDDA